MTGTVAALVGMVPEGLVLLTTLAFVVATVSLARRQTLVQELPAVEGLARVDVVCLDKTGTLTARRRPVRPAGAARRPCRTTAPGRARVCSPPPTRANATAAALAAAFPATGRRRRPASVPFSSARKWSAVRPSTGSRWVLGAPEMVLPRPGRRRRPRPGPRADELAAQGPGCCCSPVGRGCRATDDDGDALPAGLDTGRRSSSWPSGSARTPPRCSRYFTDQGVALKVISGDNPRTVGAVAAAVGVPGVTGADDAVDARTLPEDPDALADGDGGRQRVRPGHPAPEAGDGAGAAAHAGTWWR